MLNGVSPLEDVYWTHWREMPLFESIESDLSSFFVSQGSIFDSIVKALFDRITQVESRVEHHEQSLHELLVLGGGVGLSAQNEEMEYFIMTLSRQLNLVLGLLFRPYSEDTMAKMQAHQQQLASISDVLTDNESILMHLAGPAPMTMSQRPGIMEEKEVKASEGANEGITNQSMEVQTPDSPEFQPGDTLPPTKETTEQEGHDALASSSHQEGASVSNNYSPVERHSDAQLTPAISLNKKNDRKKSAFGMIHSLHQAEQRRREDEAALLKRVKEMLAQSQRQSQGGYDQMLRELQTQNDKLRLELLYHQQNQVSMDLVNANQQQQQKEMEKQLLELSNSFLATQTLQEQQINQLLENLRDFTDRYVNKSELERLAAAWLQAAKDDCVFGANAETLTTLQRDLMALQDRLRDEASSPVLAKLLEEIERVLELLQRLLALLEGDSAGLHGLTGTQLMLTLRQVLQQVEDLAHNALEDEQASQRSAASLTEFTRQMELGTASLLEAMESQQERYLQALAQLSADVEMLKRELHDQKATEQELRSQLAACPSQEETMRLMNALRDQIEASSSDYSAKMLETLDDLRSNMAGLPSIDLLDNLLHSKADRADIERLRQLLANTGLGGPSLSKSPTRCLSCDQPYPQRSRPGSAQSTTRCPHQGERPSTATSSNGGWTARSGLSYGKSHHASLPMLPSTISQLEPHDPDEDDGYDDDIGFTRDARQQSTQQILRDLAAVIETSKQRKQRHQSSYDLPVSTPAKRSHLSFANVEDKKNRIPLRRVTLSDQVVYGPSITSGFLKQQQPKKSKATLGSAREKIDYRTRPTTVIVTTDGKAPTGEVIVRAPSSSVVIRPFSELGTRGEDSRRGTPTTKQATRRNTARASD
ncbi:hypothetical protein Poli38472_008829 [Pythium oligandrum]|uniref:Uncharacterized protein n=1 Tax=Pythium oligandrum TaxID=41045 RepID=A0A8K1C455_PYTOL|nr:hypothetical protein Poli38472_008829 [Pythium oligandrum]|eukprot:TMW56181.1 hypothetical protein Poli38472_008829 [Pythium oligandrum]